MPDTLGLHSKGEDETESNLYFYGQIGILVERTARLPKKVLDVEFYTKPGYELLSLLDEEKPNMEYIKRLVSHFKSPNYTVKYGEILSREEDKIKMDKLETID